MLLLSALAAGAGTAGAASPADRVRVLVRFERNADLGERLAVARRFGAGVRRDLGEFGIAGLELPRAQVEALRRDPAVVAVEPDTVYRPLALALSELQPALDNGLYGLVLTKAVEAQARRVTGAGVRVCIVDTGIDAAHPDLAPAYRGGFDLVANDDDPDVGADPGLGGHGTMVAGIVAAALNRQGVRGIAYGAELVHARVIGPDGTAAASDVLAAVRRLVEGEGCRVVNLSLGADQRSDTEEEFYRQLLAQHDVIVVAAAGNDGSEAVSFPAAYPGVVAVGAVDRNEQHAGFSNTGPELDLAAAGVGVLSTVPRGSGGEAYVRGRSAYAATSFIFAGYTSSKGLRGRLVDCGTGNTPGEFPKSVRGAVALMRRGDAFFSVKVENAMNAGAIGAVIYNNVPEPTRGTLQTPTASDNRPWIPAVLVSQTDGAQLRKYKKQVSVVNGPTDWDSGDGTSFAAPYVAGAAALVWSVDPTLSRDRVLGLLESTAQDLGDPGLDPQFGWGLVDADAATRAAAAAH
ncbi:MAG TPA: S8 family serine peptidase [Thermoanaerobaculia bacterium]|nr:S8 family serine peptidase [Thermoanaerobaculia bacterium]